MEAHATSLAKGAATIGGGYSTMANLHEATESAVVVAFDTGNVPRVSKEFEGYPVELIICAYNDAEQRDNPGLTKARVAAVATGARLAVRDFGPAR